MRQLLALARESNLQFESIDLNEMLENLKTLLSGTLPKTIDIEVDLKSNLSQAMADPNQLHQVFLNVCLNARDATAGREASSRNRHRDWCGTSQDLRRSER